MSGKKNFINKTGKDLRITLFVRAGSNPDEKDSGRQNFQLPKDGSEVVTYGEDTGDIFLNAIRLRWKDDTGAFTSILRVETRGDAVDNMMNTNSVITFHDANPSKVTGHN